MQLKTKLVTTATVMTFAIVIILSLLFLAELLRERIVQTAAGNGVVAREVLTMTRQAVEVGLRTRRLGGESLHDAVTDALTRYQPLTDVMNAIVRYSPDVEDVAVADVAGTVLTGTDPEAKSEITTSRMNFDRLRDASPYFQMRQMLGPARVLDVAVPLDRNGQPFLVVHVGVRSSFLRNAYVPFLRNALLLILLAGFVSIVASGLLSTVVLRPIEEIIRRLESLSGGEATRPRGEQTGWLRTQDDAVVRVSDTIDRLGQQMRSTKEGYTALQANLNQMLDTLRDGLLLFTPERRAVMVSDAVAHFVEGSESMVGRRVDEIFRADTVLGATVLAAFDTGAAGARAVVERVVVEDGREVEITLDRFGEGGRDGAAGAMGTMISLRDTESAARLEQELEVSRRLAAVGQLTAGVGHEVKNPINAMVVHLELLKSKLAGNPALNGAQRHVDILSGEMQRLDGVVQTLADFSRPMRLDLREHDLCDLADAVVELTSAEMSESRVEVRLQGPGGPLLARVDGELIRQALLNLMLNAKQAMPAGGLLHLRLKREGHFAVIEVEDTGEGITPEVMPRIFELYFTTKTAGSGIGLATTYRILQMHRGALEVRSNTDVKEVEQSGTTFTLRLPYAIGSDHRTELRPEPRPEREAVSIGGRA